MTEIISGETHENETLVQLQNIEIKKSLEFASKKIKNEKSNLRLKIIVGFISILFLISLIFNIYFLKSGDYSNNNKNNSKCPETEITMTSSNGQVYNFEHFLTQNMTYPDDFNIHELVDEYIEGILSDKKYRNDTLNALDYENTLNENRRRLLTFTSYVGGSGSYIYNLNKNNLNIVGIQVWFGQFINGLRVRYSDGTYSNVVGRDADSSNHYMDTAANCLRGVIIRSGSWIDQLIFTSTQGFISNVMGGTGGTWTRINWGYTQCLKQLNVKYNGAYIAALQFGYQ